MQKVSNDIIKIIENNHKEKQVKVNNLVYYIRQIDEMLYLVALEKI